MGKLNYPPREILNPSELQRRNYNQIILWMLANNESCEWSNFEQKPIEIPISTLSRHLTTLNLKGFITKFSRGNYKITPKGKEKFLQLSKETKEIRKLSYPPDLILKRGRNYSHWILWMVYNNGFCKRSDFLKEPFSINQSSLSKSLNSLIQKGFILNENKRYLITKSGKVEYSKILQQYNLDRQTILDEERKRIDEITIKTSQFFDKFKITDDHVKFRFLNNVLKLDYSKVEVILKDEEDFHKILLFISINHPDFYPDYLSFEDFSRYYIIKKRILYFWVNEIVESDLYDLKFFKLEFSPDKYYYFHSDGKLEKILRAITEEHIAANKYLEKFGRSGRLNTIMNDILEEICEMIFHTHFKDSLRKFLPGYIKYLAYKIEIKKELTEIYDKLEGIIWQSITDVFQSQLNGNLENQYEEQIKEIDKKIDSDSGNINLYYLKIRISIYFNQYREAMKLLDDMLKNFPESEKNIKLLKAVVLRRMQNIEAGLEIIESLIEKYPKDNELLSYKAYWLQFLDNKEEAITIIQDLIEIEPEMGVYYDTFGEILMYFEDYEKAAKKFVKSMVLGANEWYIFQTYIKLGICYKVIGNHDLAIKNLNKGIELTKKNVIDPETRQKWLSIANLFLSELNP